MSMVTLERAILKELQDVTKNPKLKKKNIQEWSTSESIKANVQDGETLVHLPKLNVWVAYK